MTTPDYVSLHTHTHFSMLDGFSKTAEYLERAQELGMRGLGTSDHGNTHGSYDLVRKARELGMTGVPGCEFYVAPINPEGARTKAPVFYGPNGEKAGREDVAGNGAYLHLTIWAYTQEGLHNLFRLSSMSSAVENYYMKPRIDLDMLAEHSEGLIVSTGCPSSEISTRFLLGQDAKAHEYAGRLKDIFGDRLYVEIMEHNMKSPIERVLLPKQLELSKKLGIPLLATNDSHYAHKSDGRNHEEMLCVQSASRMDELPGDQGGTRFAFDGYEFYLKSAEEMAALFPEEQFPSALKSSLVIAEMAQDIKLDFNPTLRPNPIIPPEFPDEVAYYKHLLNTGFKARYGNASPEVKREAKARVAKEFQVIHSSNFIGYMLTVHEYLQWTREQFATRSLNGEILALPIGPGRGSVGGSVHAFLLNISEIDPVKYDLIFERFLSAGRGDTYRITYDDGSFEDVIVSETRKTQGEAKYIHQLKVGDEIDES